MPPGLAPGAWYYFALLQLAKEPRGGVAIPAGLEQDVDDLAVLVDGPPEVLTLKLYGWASGSLPSRHGATRNSQELSTFDRLHSHRRHRSSLHRPRIVADDTS